VLGRQCVEEWMKCETGEPIVLYNAQNGAELAKLDLVDTPGADKNTSAKFGEV
jgi:hypothetical protein